MLTAPIVHVVSDKPRQVTRLNANLLPTARLNKGLPTYGKREGWERRGWYMRETRVLNSLRPIFPELNRSHLALNPFSLILTLFSRSPLPISHFPFPSLSPVLLPPPPLLLIFRVIAFYSGAPIWSTSGKDWFIARVVLVARVQSESSSSLLLYRFTLSLFPFSLFRSSASSRTSVLCALYLRNPGIAPPHTSRDTRVTPATQPPTRPRSSLPSAFCPRPTRYCVNAKVAFSPSSAFLRNNEISLATVRPPSPPLLSGVAPWRLVRSYTRELLRLQKPIFHPVLNTRGYTEPCHRRRKQKKKHKNASTMLRFLDTADFRSGWYTVQFIVSPVLVVVAHVLRVLMYRAFDTIVKLSNEYYFF